MNIIDNDLLSIQEARILAENAVMAKKQLAKFSQERLDIIVEGMLDTIVLHLEEGYHFISFICHCTKFVKLKYFFILTRSFLHKENWRA